MKAQVCTIAVYADEEIEVDDLPQRIFELLGFPPRVPSYKPGAFVEVYVEPDYRRTYQTLR
jgi:hypothetical protein